MVERILADQRRGEIARDDPERGEAALHRRRLADPRRAVLAIDPDPGAALLGLVGAGPVDLKRLDVANFHGGVP